MWIFIKKTEFEFLTWWLTQSLTFPCRGFPFSKIESRILRLWNISRLQKKILFCVFVLSLKQSRLFKSVNLTRRALFLPKSSTFCDFTALWEKGHGNTVWFPWSLREVKFIQQTLFFNFSHYCCVYVCGCQFPLMTSPTSFSENKHSYKSYIFYYLYIW